MTYDLIYTFSRLTIFSLRVFFRILVNDFEEGRDPALLYSAHLAHLGFCRGCGITLAAHPALVCLLQGRVRILSRGIYELVGAEFTVVPSSGCTQRRTTKLANARPAISL